MPTVTLLRGTTASLITTGAAPGSGTLASAARSALSAEYDNSSNLYSFADFEFSGSFSVAPTDDYQISLFIIPCLDGSNYADGSDSVEASELLAVAWASVRSVSTAQRLVFSSAFGERIELPPCKFKILVRNETDQTIAASWAISMFPYTWQVN